MSREDFRINKLNYDVDKDWFIVNQPDLSAVDEATKLSKKRLLIRLLRSLQNIKK